MESTTVMILIAVVAVAGIAAWFFINKNTADVAASNIPTPVSAASKEMQLQAYERLTLLADRIALPNLIPRVNQPGLTARDMQMLLTLSIKEEFDYNITQQIYVSYDAWTVVKQLKEQSTLIVNQVANQLPADATGADLNRVLIEFLMNDPKGKLHEMACEIISSEAKKIM
jgi:hypothetical protein